MDDDLVVRMVGDASSYQKMLAESVESTRHAAQHVEEAAGRIEKLGEGLRRFGELAVQSLEALGAAEFLKGAFEKWEQAEGVLIHLEAAVRANGRAVGPTVDSYKEFAVTMSALTAMSDLSVLTLLRQAESFGLTGAAAEKAAKDAIALAEVTGHSAEGLMRVTAEVAKGDLKTAMAFRRMIPQLREARDESQFLAKYQTLVNSGLEAASQEAQTAGGQFRQLGNVYGLFLRDIGKVVSEGVEPFVAGLRELARMLNLLPPSAKLAITVTAALAAAAVAAGPALAGLSLAAGVLFNPFVIAAAAAGVALSVWINSVGGVKKAVEVVTERVGEFAHEHERLLLIVGLVAAAVAAAVVAYRVFYATVILVNSVLAALRVYQIAGAVAWGVWQAAVLAAWAVAVLFVAQMAFWFSLMTGGAVAQAAWTAAVTAGAVALAIYNAAVAVYNAIGAGAIIVALGWAAAAGAYQLVALAAAAALWAWNAAQAVWAALVLSGSVAFAAWTVMVLAGTAVTWLWNVALAAVNALLGAGAIAAAASGAAAVAWAAGALVAKVATWLFNAALAVMNVLLAPVVIIAAVAALLALAGTLALLAGIAAGVATALVGAYRAGASLYEVLSTIPTASGPIKAITTILDEQLGIIKDIVRALKVDMDLAWEFMYLAAQLAVLRVRDLWAPLWSYIKAGFFTLWELIGTNLKVTVLEAVAEAAAASVKTLDLTGIATKRLNEEMEKVRKDAETLRELSKTLAETHLAEAGAEFGKQFVESDAVKAKLGELKKLRDKLTKAESDAAEREKQRKAGEEAAKQYNEGFGKEIMKLDAVLFESAEAMRRVREFNMLLASQLPQPRGVTDEGVKSRVAEARKEVKSLTEGLAGRLEATPGFAEGAIPPDAADDIAETNRKVKEIEDSIKRFTEATPREVNTLGVATGRPAPAAPAPAPPAPPEFPVPLPPALGEPPTQPVPAALGEPPTQPPPPLPQVVLPEPPPVPAQVPGGLIASASAGWEQVAAAVRDEGDAGRAASGAASADTDARLDKIPDSLKADIASFREALSADGALTRATAEGTSANLLQATQGLGAKLDPLAVIASNTDRIPVAAAGPTSDPGLADVIDLLKQIRDLESAIAKKPTNGIGVSGLR